MMTTPPTERRKKPRSCGCRVRRWRKILDAAPSCKESSIRMIDTPTRSCGLGPAIHVYARVEIRRGGRRHKAPHESQTDEVWCKTRTAGSMKVPVAAARSNHPGVTGVSLLRWKRRLPHSAHTPPQHFKPSPTSAHC